MCCRQSGGERSGRSEPSQSDEDVEVESSSYNRPGYQVHSGPFRERVPFGIQPRPSSASYQVRSFPKQPLLQISADEEEEDDFDLQLSRARERQIEKSHRGRSEPHDSRHDDHGHDDRDGYLYGMHNDPMDDDRGYRDYPRDHGRGRGPPGRHEYERDHDRGDYDREHDWSHSRDHATKDGSRHRNGALPSLMSSRRPDVAVAAAEVRQLFHHND